MLFENCEDEKFPKIEKIQLYLQDSGWEFEEFSEGLYKVKKKFNDKEGFLVIPKDSTNSDYNFRISQTIESLSVIEDISIPTLIKKIYSYNPLKKIQRLKSELHKCETDYQNLEIGWDEDRDNIKRTMKFLEEINLTDITPQEIKDAISLLKGLSWEEIMEGKQ